MRILVALGAGLACGFLLRSSDGAEAVVQIAEPIGQVWVNALRMCVIPLVVSCIIVSVGSSLDTTALGRIGWRAAALFFALLTSAAIFAAALGWPLFAALHLDPEVTRSLIGATTAGQTGPRAVAGFAQWIVALVPANPIQAAADGAMLPLIVFSLLLGLAVRRAGEEPSQSVLGFFHGIAESMFVLVRWAIWMAPVGVFALAAVLAARTGLAIAGAVAYYIAVVVGLTILFAFAVLYPLAALAGGVPLSRFVRATLPAQAVAFSSRSSLASLPAMVEGARSVLGLGEEITVFVVPLAGSIFRVGSAIAQTLGVLFLARLYEVPLTPPQFVSVVLAIVLTTFSVPGIPGGTIIAIASVLPVAGLPPAGIGLLLGIDAIPDMFRTAANVTGGMTAAVVLARRHPIAVGMQAPSGA